jgi:hypothetical protein
MADWAAAEQQQRDASTAAIRVAAASESEISAAVAELWSADPGTLNQIEPLASLLSADRFQATFKKLKERRLSSPIRNDAGYFVYLLRVEIRALRAASALPSAAHGPQGESGIERMKREDPDEYARRMEAHFNSLAHRFSEEDRG